MGEEKKKRDLTFVVFQHFFFQRGVGEQNTHYLNSSKNNNNNNKTHSLTTLVDYVS